MYEKKRKKKYLIIFYFILMYEIVCMFININMNLCRIDETDRERVKD